MSRIRKWKGRRRQVVFACAALVAGLAHTSGARASVPHVVTEGETLWSIATKAGVSTSSVASFNGMAEETPIVVGQTIQIPSLEEGGVALSAAPAPADPAATSTSAPAAGTHTVVAGESLSSVAAANGVSVADLAAVNGLAVDTYLTVGQSLSVPAATVATVPEGMGTIPSPSGDVALDPVAADSWNAMRNDSLSNYGVDLYPAGPVSGYRTYEQQAELYELYLSGQGPPANPPGTSSHEFGTAVDLAEPIMRDIVDQIGGSYGWYGMIPSEWWHVAHGP